MPDRVVLRTMAAAGGEREAGGGKGRRYAPTGPGSLASLGG
jgi:hypothetical protein